MSRRGSTPPTASGPLPINCERDLGAGSAMQTAAPRTTSGNSRGKGDHSPNHFDLCGRGLGEREPP